MSVLIGGTFLEQPAEASYTAYTQRENDWKERSDKGGEIAKICNTIFHDGSFILSFNCNFT